MYWNEAPEVRSSRVCTSRSSPECGLTNTGRLPAVPKQVTLPPCEEGRRRGELPPPPRGESRLLPNEELRRSDGLRDGEAASDGGVPTGGVPAGGVADGDGEAASDDGVEATHGEMGSSTARGAAVVPSALAPAAPGIWTSPAAVVLVRVASAVARRGERSPGVELLRLRRGVVGRGEPGRGERGRGDARGPPVASRALLAGGCVPGGCVPAPAECVYMTSNKPSLL